jgi:hypothetical protein
MECLISERPRLDAVSFCLAPVTPVRLPSTLRKAARWIRQ